MFIFIIFYLGMILYCCMSKSVEEEFKNLINELSENLEKKEIVE